MLLIFILFCVAMVGLSQLLERKVSQWRSQPLAAERTDRSACTATDECFERKGEPG